MSNETSRAWHAAHPERNREAQRRWYAKNKEREREKARIYRERNPESVRAARQRWESKNPEKLRARDQKWNPITKARRRARLNGVKHEPWTRAEVWERGEGICHICTKPIDPTARWEADHVVPISRGGDDVLDNLLPAHLRCNRSKGAT